MLFSGGPKLGWLKMLKNSPLDFNIPPAWYQTNWFRGLCAAALLALLWAAYRLRVAQLQQQESKLRETIETLPAMAWVTGPDGSNQFVNRRWLEYTGLSEKDAKGDSWKGLVHPEDVDRYVRRWMAVLAVGGTFEEEARFREVSGEYRWFLTRGVPLRDKRGKILRWYGISTDIEDRKRAEQLQADLAHVNRVSMLGELSAALSHELKQPINAAVISANTTLEWLKRKQPNVEKAQESTAIIVKAALRAAEIIDRLRSLYKKAPTHRQLLDVNEIVGEMIAVLRSEGNSFAVSLRADLAPDLPHLMADRVQLQQVLMNLMLNAIEAMKETGGVLTVKSEPKDGHVVVSVSDTGVGLPPEKAERIFDAFFTTKPQGSGMGLAISRAIIESHGGRLWATPNNGRGASFHFTLPTAAHAGEAPAPGA